MMRYGNEGRPEHMAPQGIENRKQVRFDQDFEQRPQEEGSFAYS